MKTITKLPPLLAAMLIAMIMATPAVADTGEVLLAAETETDAPADGGTSDPAEDDGGRPSLAETPQDRFGLLLLGALGAAGVAGWIGMRRQLSGERPSASGEFRWR